MSKLQANMDYVTDIVTDYEKLSERCDEFDLSKNNKDAQKIILTLKNTLRANKDIVALSANQVGFNKRIICMSFNGDIRTFINPIVTRNTGFELSREYCNSIPGKCFIRPRFSTIDVTYQTPLGKIQSVSFMGLAAKLFQHHIDHLDGLLLSDIGMEIDKDFDDATDEEREAVINMYLDSLDIKTREIETSINEDPEAKELTEAIKFMDSVQRGETVVERIPLTEEEIEELKKSADDFEKETSKED